MNHWMKLTGSVAGFAPVALLAMACATPLLGGCGAMPPPCMQYVNLPVTKVVSMRGYGAVQTTEMKRMCARRETLPQD